jgi:hypothetical protein
VLRFALASCASAAFPVAPCAWISARAAASSPAVHGFAPAFALAASAAVLRAES